MNIPTLFPIRVAVVLWATMAIAHPANNSDETVKTVFQKFLEQPLTESCRSSIQRIEKYFSTHHIDDGRQRDFYDSFDHGEYRMLTSDAKFHNNMLKCLSISKDMVYSTSEYPFSFCYGYDPQDSDSDVYTICIPSPCEQDDLTLLGVWRHHTHAIFPNATPLDEAQCVRSRRHQQWYSQASYLFLYCLFMASILCVSLSTVYDCMRGEQAQSTSKQVLLAFSVKRNAMKIFSLPRNSKTAITCMAGMRFLTLLHVFFGHSFAWIHAFLINRDEFMRDMSGSFSSQWISNFWLAVDTFFVLGGTVNAYGFFLKFNRAEKKPNMDSASYWLRFYRHRVVRLWPAYAYTILQTVLLSGSQFREYWPDLDPTTQCSQHGWKSLLFIGSLYDNRCNGHTWYVSTEFFFYLLSPIFLIAYVHSRRAGLTLCTVTILLSAVLRGGAMILYNMPPTQLPWNNPPIFNADIMTAFRQFYSQPQYRIGPYLIGIILGYELAKLTVSPVNRSRLFVVAGWTMSTVAALTSMFGLYPVLQSWNWPVYYVVYGALHRSVYALAIAWVIFACHTGYGGLINRLLSFSIFTPLATLSYSVYLNHLVVLSGSNLELMFPYKYVGKLPIFVHSVLVFVLCYGMGLQCTLAAEFPALNLERILLRPSKPSAHPPKSVEHSPKSVECSNVVHPTDCGQRDIKRGFSSVVVHKKCKLPLPVARRGSC